MKPYQWYVLGSERSGATALETAIVLPVVLMVILALMTSYSLLSSLRAVEFGLEGALRFAAVSSTTATPTSIAAAFKTAASRLSADVGAASTVVVTSTLGYQPGRPVQVAVTYRWTAPGGGVIFPAFQLDRTASVTVIN